MTPDSIQDLIRAHQDGVYTVCLHVLRHPQDAEDAAQEALIKVAAEGIGLREPRAFKSWLYRVVFRTAVDHARRRATRQRIEKESIPMTSAPLTDAQRDAIHEAMAALPDDDRLMLVEHYFEKTTIAELGRREGISDVAMGKRVEKAREKLKRGLAGAGLVLGSSQVAQALDSVQAATAPAGLLSEVSGVEAAGLAAGGMTVGMKLSVSSVVLAAILLLGVGGAGGYLIAAGRPRESRRIQELESQVAELSKRSPPSTRANNPPPKRPVDVTAPPPAPSVIKKLEASLEKYKTLIDRQDAKWKAWSAANPGKGIDAREMAKDFHALARELEGIRDQIFEEPETFLTFVREVGNTRYIWNLFDVTLARRVGESIMQQEFSGLPETLADGLLDLLKTGSDGVRDQVLGFMAGVKGQPEEFKNHYLAMLTDPNGNLVSGAAKALGTFSLTREDLVRLTAVFEGTSDRHQRKALVRAMWSVGEARDWMVSNLESGRLPDLDPDFASALYLQLITGATDDFADRTGRAVSAALSRPADEQSYYLVLQVAPSLPRDRAKEAFVAALSHAPTQRLRDAAAACLGRIDAGDASRKTLSTILNETWKAILKDQK